MLNFTCNLSTKVLFGKGALQECAEEIKAHSDKVLLLYGGGSIKRTGVYDAVTKLLTDNGISFVELSGVKPNPSVESARAGVELCRKEGVGFILAVGGGSVIDCAKAIAGAVRYDGDVWDFYMWKAVVEDALPIGSVLTLAAAGSEMNGNSVLSNEATEEKLPISSDLLRPKFSVLDPTYTFTVPANQTSAGCVDIFVHILEAYFSVERDAFVQDRMCEALMATCIQYAPVVLEDPENYEARANLMWAGSLAINGLILCGKSSDWATHMIEHEVSAIYDVTHGVGLAILSPHWMAHVLDEDNAAKFAEYAENVWGIQGANDLESARAAIAKTREFFSDLAMPATLREIGVEESRLEEMAEKAVARGELGNFKKLGKDDVLAILKAAY